MRKTVFLLLLLSATLLAAACQRDRVDGAPPTPTLAGQAASPLASPTLALEATLPLSVTPTITTTAAPTVTAALSATLSVSDTVEATAQVALYIRSGPGLRYAIIGVLAATGRVAVLGRSPEGDWLRIECPTGMDAPECWVVGDPSFWDFEQIASLPAAPAPPLPADTPTPAPTPCTPLSPAGWASYTIVAGDTLIDLAARFGVSVAQLQGVNCLPSDAIVAGQTIFTPAADTVGSAATMPGANAVAAAVAARVPAPPKPPSPGSNAGSAPARASIGFSFPNDPSAGCVPLDSAPAFDPARPVRVVVTDEFFAPASEFEVTDLVCLYVVNVDPGQPVTVTVKPAGRDPLPVLAGSAQTAWTYFAVPGALQPEETSHPFEVQAVQAGRSAASASFTLIRPATPKLRMAARVVAPGGRAQAALAGFTAGARLHLYRLNLQRQQWEWVPNRPLRMVTPNAQGEAWQSIETDPSDAGQCFLVDDGHAPSHVTLYDPRVFAVGIDPNQCP